MKVINAKNNLSSSSRTPVVAAVVVLTVAVVVLEFAYLDTSVHFSRQFCTPHPAANDVCFAVRFIVMRKHLVVNGLVEIDALEMLRPCTRKIPQATG